MSLFDGYRNYPEKTAEVLADGWYFSGDYGFVHDGEYYVVGRKKDLIIVAGNNVFPEDVEDAVGTVPGVMPGRVVAFGVEDERLGTEVLCVIAEIRGPDRAGEEGHAPRDPAGRDGHRRDHHTRLPRPAALADQELVGQAGTLHQPGPGTRGGGVALNVRCGS